MRFTILGCGSSMGVPKPNGDFGNCNPNEKKNFRTRCSALISIKKKHINRYFTRFKISIIIK